MSSESRKRPFTYFTRFSLEGKVGGGGRRALQIIQEFDEDQLLCIRTSGYQLSDWATGIKDLSTRSCAARHVASYLEKCLAYLVCGPDYLKWSGQGRRHFLGFWRLSKNLKKETAHLAEEDTVLIDDPYYFRHLIFALRKKGVKVVGILHNLETLFGSYCKQEHRLHLMNKELSVFRKCDLIVAISREETFFLTNNGVNVIFHQYYPPKFIEQELQ